MKNPVVVVFVKNLTSGGAEKQAVMLANALHDAGINVEFAVFNAAHVHQKMRDMLSDAVPFTAFEGKLRQRYSLFEEFLKSRDVNVIFSYLTAANAIAMAAAPQGTRVVTGLRCSRLSLHKHIIDAVASRLAAATVANSHSGCNWFTSKGFPKQKVEVIHNFIDPIHPYEAHAAGERVNVVCVGRFVPIKDLPTAIEAFGLASKCDVPMRLTLVGYGPLEKSLRELVKRRGLDDSVEFVINPPNVEAYERHADIFLMTSKAEGLSNAIMEAMNADLPIVATKVGDADAMVKDGDNGILVQPGDVNSIAVALVELAADPDRRARMGFRSKEILRQHFGREVFTRRYLDLLERL